MVHIMTWSYMVGNTLSETNVLKIVYMWIEQVCFVWQYGQKPIFHLSLPRVTINTTVISSLFHVLVYDICYGNEWDLDEYRVQD